MAPIRTKKIPIALRMALYISILLLLVMISGLIWSLSSFNSPVFREPIITTPTPTTQPQDVVNLQSEIASLQDEVKFFQQQLDSISQVPTNPATALQLTEIKNSLEGLNGRIGDIENALLDNPEKALSITLLRKDMQLLQEKFDSNTESMRDEINRVSSLN